MIRKWLETKISVKTGIYYCSFPHHMVPSWGKLQYEHYTVLHSWVSLIHTLYAEQVILHVKQRGLNDFNCLIEDQAFLRSHNSAPRPPPLPLSVSKWSLFLIIPVCRRSSLLTGGGGGRVWSRIIRPQESLGLYKSFNPLWCKPTCVWHEKPNEDLKQFL
jgi:hypothetical protein